MKHFTKLMVLTVLFFLLNSNSCYSDRKLSTGFVLAALKTTKVTASKEIANTMKTAKTNTYSMSLIFKCILQFLY